jgi:hypothetical protein
MTFPDCDRVIGFCDSIGVGEFFSAGWDGFYDNVDAGAFLFFCRHLILGRVEGWL